jgi:hypothetical protein
MELLIHWCGFIGAWFLFAGPIYQAALELSDQDIEMDRIHQARAQVIHPAPVSAYWWFLPPVKLYLERKRSNEYRRRFVRELAPEDVEAFFSLMNKATSWLMVGLGGLLIAVKETYELGEAYEAPHLLFFGIILVMILISISYTVGRMRNAKRIQRDIAVQ